MDTCDRLWVLDTGTIGIEETTVQVCPYTLNVFDLTTDKLLRQYRLRSEDINQVYNSFDSHIIWFSKFLVDLGSLRTLQFLFYYVEHFYRQHRRWFGKRRLRWRLRLYVRWTRLRFNCVLVAAKYILANNAQLLHAGSFSGWLQYRRFEFPMGNWRYFWNESVANIRRRLSDAFLSSPQQLSRIRGIHENSKRPAVVSK